MAINKTNSTNTTPQPHTNTIINKQQSNHNQHNPIKQNTNNKISNKQTINTQPSTKPAKLLIKRINKLKRQAKPHITTLLITHRVNPNNQLVKYQYTHPKHNIKYNTTRKLNQPQTTIKQNQTQAINKQRKRITQTNH